MSKYGRVAGIAAEILSKSQSGEPNAAWKTASALVFPYSPSSQAKGCPRDAFLGLCSLGVIFGVSPGNYTRSVKNKGYIVRALAALRSNPALVGNEDLLWQIATNGINKVPNHQMDVLTSLWRSGSIRV